MTRPIKVLYVLNAPDGGATQGILELLEGLRGSNYQAFAIVPSAPNNQQRANFLRVTDDFAVVPIGWWNTKAHLPFPGRLRSWAGTSLRTLCGQRSLWEIVRLIGRWKIDIVYTNTALILPGALAARVTGRPHLWHIKEWVGRHARTRFPLPDPLLARTFMSLSDRVLVMSRFIGGIFDNGGHPMLPVIVNDPVDVDRFSNNQNGPALRRKLGVGNDEPLIAMAASLQSTWKKHEIFVEVAAKVAAGNKRARFAVFGPEPVRHANSTYNQAWDNFQQLKRLARDRGLNGRFAWAGFCSDIPQMMNAIDVLVHPCDIEPFGRVAIEAMAAGKPVVGPDRGGISESVTDGMTGMLVPAGNENAFAAAASLLAGDESLRNRMGRAGRELVARKFSLAQHVDHITRLYTEVLTEKGLLR